MKAKSFDFKNMEVIELPLNETLHIDGGWGWKDTFITAGLAIVSPAAAVTYAGHRVYSDRSRKQRNNEYCNEIKKEGFVCA